MSIDLLPQTDKQGAPSDKAHLPAALQVPLLPVRAADRAKWCLDFLLALCLLVLTAPLLLVAALLVMLTSRGSAFYSQTRLGRGGRPYRLHKLRTMYQDCELETGPCWCRHGDPRITPLGRILRKTHIDELPQLWNVLRGEMSLVGPRPERPEMVHVLARHLPGYGERLSVRPGLTGLAQVQLPPDFNLADVQRKLFYDVYYVRRLGCWLDCRLLLATPLHILGLPFAVSRLLLGLPGFEEVEAPAAGANGIPEPPPQGWPAPGPSEGLIQHPLRPSAETP